MATLNPFEAEAGARSVVSPPRAEGSSLFGTPFA